MPVGIRAGDQGVLLRTPPFLELFLTLNRHSHVFRLLEIHELMNVIAFRKPVRDATAVLIQPPTQIVGHTDVHNTIIPIGKHVNVVLCQRFLHSLTLARNDRGRSASLEMTISILCHPERTTPVPCHFERSDLTRLLSFRAERRSRAVEKSYWRRVYPTPKDFSTTALRPPLEMTKNGARSK